MPMIQTEWERRKTRKEKAERKAVWKAGAKERKARGKKHKFIQTVANKLQFNTPKSEQWFSKFLEEHRLWHFFMANVPLNDCIPDFISLKYRIVIEIDGSIHWSNKKQKARDKAKNEIYQALGYKLFRINHNDTTAALAAIEEIKNLVYDKVALDGVKREPIKTTFNL